MRLWHRNYTLHLYLTFQKSWFIKVAVLDGIPFHFALTLAYPVRIEFISKPVHWKPSTVAANTYKTHPGQTYTLRTRVYDIYVSYNWTKNRLPVAHIVYFPCIKETKKNIFNCKTNDSWEKIFPSKFES